MEIKYIDRSTGKIRSENPPAEGLLKFLYNNPIGKSAFLPIATKKIISHWYGKMMNRASSIKRIQPFIDDLNIYMGDSLKNVDEFTSFDDFFYRELKPNSRSIEDGLISPGDGKILAFENISAVNDFFVKGKRFTLQDFLQDDKLTKKYINSSMIILRLAPNDYHRYHFPFKGIPSESKLIKGKYLSVSPYALLNHFTKVFTENKREICQLTIENNREILIIPVGATMVGSIHSTYTPNKPIEKGEEMGYFSFGGSTIVLLFDAKQFSINADLLANTQSKMETYVKMGEEIASENK